MRREPFALAAVAMATFVTYLDNNIVNVAMPSIRADLGLGIAGLEWVMSSYILVFGSLLILCGRLADLFGQRRLFLLGLSLFMLASLLAGLARDAESLIAARALQGLGAAALTPTTLSIISATFPDARRRGAAVGVWNAVGALALAVGPLLGGLLSENLGWGWIFFINLPIGALTLGLGALAIRVPSAKRRSKLDLPGVATSSGTLAALTFALIEGPNFGWTSPVILACLAAAPLLGIAFVLIERRAKAPMMALGLFRRGVFSGGLATMFIWAFGLFGIYFFTTIYLQDVAGFTPTQAGLSFVPMALLMVAGSVFSQPAAEWIGARRSVALSMGLIACGIAGAALLGEDATFAQVMIPLVVIGVGGGFTTSLTATIVGAMPAGEVGVATALLNTVRQTGGLLGIACIGAVVANFPDFLMGYHMGLLFSATLVAIGAVLAFLTLRRVTPAGLPERPTRTAELDRVA